MTYAEKLKDPRWQKKRLEVLNRHNFTCEYCGATELTLHVHHRYYISGRMPWEYPDFCYQVLCFQCHGMEPEFQEMRRQEGTPLFELWEVGLDHFGERIFDMFAEESVASNGASNEISNGEPP